MPVATHRVPVSSAASATVKRRISMPPSPVSSSVSPVTATFVIFGKTAKNAVSTVAAGPWQAMSVPATGPISIELPSRVYPAVKLLQPPLPETVPSANVAVAATSCGTGTAAPPSVAYSASCQVVPSKGTASAPGSPVGAADGEEPPAAHAARAIDVIAVRTRTGRSERGRRTAWEADRCMLDVPRFE